MKPSRVACAFAAAVALSFGTVLTAQTFENLGSFYEKLRGINFVANYPSLSGLIGNPAAPFPYYGVASPTAMWKFYDENGTTAAEVAQQLDRVKKTGINGLRVFLSYPAWLHYRSNPPPGVTGNAFLNRFKHFVGQCHARGIRVMPVLWDGVSLGTGGCAEAPDYTDPLGDIPAAPNNVSNISYWHRNPGHAVMTQILAQTVPFELSLAGLYIRDCISVFHDPAQNYSQALLMWDVMNELQDCVPGTAVTFVTRSLQTIKYYAPNDVTTWGWVINDVNGSLAIATLPECDVLNLHCYNHRKGYVASLLHDATHINDISPPTPKPVIFTEIGDPAVGFSYEDAIDYCSTVLRYGTEAPPGAPLGVGFMPWQFSIGHVDRGPPVIIDHSPFLDRAGLFYGDGEVRDLAVVQKYVQLAISHGINPSGLWGALGPLDWPIQKASNDPHFVPAYPVVQYAHQSQQDGLMNNPWVFSIPGACTWEQFQILCELFRQLLSHGVWPGDTSQYNNNPWAWPTLLSTGSPTILPGYTPYGSAWPYLPPQYVSPLGQYYYQSIVDYSGDGPTPWMQMLAQVELQVQPTWPPGWLTPSIPGPNQQAHVDIVADRFLRPFVALAGQYLLNR